MGKIRIKRKAYTRKAYTRKDGTRVKATKVPATTFDIKDPGKPGRRARGAKAGPHKGEKKWITKKGKLGGPGYTDKASRTRHGLLNKAVKKAGYRSTLGSIMALERSGEISKTDKKKLAADRRWLVDKHGGPGSFGKRKKKG